MSTWKSARISARRGLGRSRCDRAAVPGRERGHLRVARAGRGPAPGPGGRAPAAGPRSRIANGAESPKCSRSISLAREDSVPGMSSVVGSEAALDAGADHAEDDEDQRGDGQHRARVAQRQRWAPARIRSRGITPPPAPPLRTRGSLAVRGTGGSEQMRKTVLRTLRSRRCSRSRLPDPPMRCGSRSASSSPRRRSRRRRCRSTTRADQAARLRQDQTADGSLPPILKRLMFWFDKHGAVETGLPICTKGKLMATTPAQARKICAARSSAPASAKRSSTSRTGADPGLLADHDLQRAPAERQPGRLRPRLHDVGGPSTFIVPVEIQKVNDGRYGFKTVANIPEIASGYGIPLYGRLTIGREWNYKGKTLSYANASCPRPPAGESSVHLQRRHRPPGRLPQTLHGDRK